MGELIWSLDGDYGTVEAVVTIDDANQPMYNLTVDEAHTFFIGDGDWLVHNHNFGACNTDKIDYGDGISEYAIQYRNDTQMYEGGNVVVVKLKNGVSSDEFEQIVGDWTNVRLYGADNEYVVARNIPKPGNIRDGGYHAEHVIRDFLDDSTLRLGRDDVVEFYSEFSPCTTGSVGLGQACSYMIPQSFPQYRPNRNNAVLYSFPYNASGRAIRNETFTDIFKP